MKKHLNNRVIVAVIIAVLAMDLLCVMFNYLIYMEIDIKHTTSLAETVANTCTLVIDGDRVAEYETNRQRTTQYYEIWNKLIDYRNTNSDIVEMTVLFFDEEGGQVIFDTNLEEDGGFLGDYFSYDTEQEKVKEKLIECQEALTLEYATHTNYYVPLKSSFNIPVGYVIVGIDTLKNQQEQILYLIRLSLIITCITVFLGIFLIWFMGRNIVRHIKNMTNAAAHYGQRLSEEEGISPLQKVTVNTGDELERLWESVKKMEQDILNSASSLVIATWNSNHDSMTQMFNKRYYQDFLEKAGDREDIGIIYLDIDNLKKVNDTYGHEKGDEVIIKTADFIKKYEGEGVVGCRIGGDEFVMIFCDVTTLQMKDIIQKMHGDEDCMLAPWIEDFCCRIAMGGAHRRKDERLEETIKRAEERMYRDKHSVR